MNSKRLYFVLLGVIGLLCIGLLAGAYGANSLLASQANKLTALKAKSLAAAQEQHSLIKAKKDIQKYGDLEKIAQTVVPQDKNQAEAVREIVNIAASSGVSLAAINFPSSTLGTTVIGSGAGATTPAPTAAAPAAGSAKTAGLSQLQPVKNIPGVYQLLITVEGDTTHPVPYNKLISFLSDLEHNRRTAQVSTINLQPTAGDRSQLTFTLSLSEYIKP